MHGLRWLRRLSIPSGSLLSVALVRPGGCWPQKVSTDGDAVAGPATPSGADVQFSFQWRSGLGTPTSATTTACLGGVSGTADLEEPSMDDRHRAFSAGPSDTEQPLPDACPDDDDTVFWDEVYRQIAEACGNHPDDNVILEIECDAVGDGDVYHFRARVRCNGAT